MKLRMEEKDGKEGAAGRRAGAERLISIVSSLPKTISFSGKSEERAARDFSAAGLGGICAGRYLSGASLLSALFGAACLLAALFFLEAQLALAAGLLAFGCMMAIFLSLPRLLAARRRALLESELPFVLREIAAFLDVGLPFEKAIERVGGGEYALSGLFAECFSQISAGQGVQQALANLSASTGSLPIKRAALLLSSIYETGGKPEPLKRMSEELSESLLQGLRAQSGRFSLLAIAFIASSALIPSFFIVYASVAPALSGAGVGALEFYAFFFLVFPMIDLAVLAAMLLSLPPQSGKRPDDWSLACEYAGRMHGVGSLKAALAALFAASAIAAGIAFLSGSPPVAAMLLCIAPTAYALLSYLASKGISESESLLPDALYSAAATHRIYSSERMLSSLASGGFGRLSEAFGIALARQKAGESFEQSLLAAEAHCPSPLVRRAFSLLIVAHQTGADMYFAMRECASDVVSFFSLVRERAALLSMQRYTILASSALLVPAILGAVAHISPELSENAQLGLLASEGSKSAEGAIDASGIASACQMYLLVNAALCSALLALMEGNSGKAPLYFLPCALLSQAVFSAVSSGAFLPLAP